jgi:hypothetical protein
VTHRRGFITGLISLAVASPAIIRTPGLLMPIKPIRQMIPRVVGELIKYNEDLLIYGCAVLEYNLSSPDPLLRHIPIDEWSKFT